MTSELDFLAELARLLRWAHLNYARPLFCYSVGSPALQSHPLRSKILRP
jgi:hypothetical protein